MGVFKRGNTWTAMWNEPSLTGRKRRSKGGFRTKRAATEYYDDRIREIRDGTYVAPQKIALADYMRQWLSDYAMVNLRPRVYERYHGIVELHIIPRLGHLPLSGLRPMHIARAKADWLRSGNLRTGAGLAPSTVRQHQTVLHEALDYAVRLGVLRVNAASSVPLPSVRRSPDDIRPMNAEEAQRFLLYCEKSQYYSLFFTALHTGMRMSELLGLRWRNVALDQAELMVVENLQWYEGEPVVDDPKTPYSRRRIDLTPANVAVIREHRERQEARFAALGEEVVHPETFVFCYPDGVPYKGTTVKTAFYSAARRAGIEGVRPHDLRHTHATLMLAAGIHPKVVSERLGHSSVSVTLDIYSHVLPGLQEAAAARFGEVFTNGAVEAN